ncbi:MAG: efflux RND transporter periplasmic adaptor subunit [Ignavibacterium sp.]|nr:MAG: efflux RND transporter periplasmic adaptor subunit [Ignavibacterium sp.]
MKKEIKILSLLFLTIFVVFVALSCGDSTGNEKEGNNPDNKEPSVYVKTKELKLESFVDDISVLGVAKAIQQANLSSDEGGKIKEFRRDKGSYVKKGEVIIVMDNDVLKANMEAAKAQYERAESTYVRQKKVFEERVTSELQYLNSKFERDAAKANYDLMQARYDRTFIKAPFSGIVDIKYSEIGENVMQGAPIVSLVSVGDIKVEAGVPENYVNMVRKGSNVKIVFKDLQNESYNAQVTYVGHTISTNNRTFPIEIRLNNKNGKIKPELSAQVFIEKERLENVFILPEETVTGTDLGYIVFVEENGVAKKREVEIISRSDDKIAVRGGLKEGENLIIVGFQNLIDGERVTVVE